jgi:hypothetical protein
MTVGGSCEPPETDCRPDRLDSVASHGGEESRRPKMPKRALARFSGRHQSLSNPWLWSFLCRGARSLASQRQGKKRNPGRRDGPGLRAPGTRLAHELWNTTQRAYPRCRVGCCLVGNETGASKIQGFICPLTVRHVSMKMTMRMVMRVDDNKDGGHSAQHAQRPRQSMDKQSGNEDAFQTLRRIWGGRLGGAVFTLGAGGAPRIDK